MNRQDDRQISHHPKNTSARQLVCPHCQEAFTLTWRRYWAAPMGYYRCPKCRQMFHPMTIFLPWVLAILSVGATLLGILVAIFT